MLMSHSNRYCVVTWVLFSVQKLFDAWEEPRAFPFLCNHSEELALSIPSFISLLSGDWYLCVCKAEDAQLPPCPSQFGYKTRIHTAESIILYNWVLIFLYTHQCWSQWDRTCAVQGDSHFFTFFKTFGTRWCVWNYWRCKRNPPPWIPLR